MNKQLPISSEIATDWLKRLRPLDLAVALKITAGSGLAPVPEGNALCDPEAGLFWLAAFSSFAVSLSHCGISFGPESRIADWFPPTELSLPGGEISLEQFFGDAASLAGRFPEQVVLEDELERHPTAALVVRPSAQMVYLSRWQKWEAEAAAAIRMRLQAGAFDHLSLEASSLREAIHYLFPEEEVTMNPWQAAASLSALTHSFSLITGGPGTGKTTTVAKLILLLLSLPEADCPQVIRTAAPTGKAAERLREAFQSNVEQLLSRIPDPLQQLLRSRLEKCLHPSCTLHTLLGSRGKAGFSFHARHLLQADVVIVDEASMVDLEMFLSLMRALPPQTRLVLLGDRHQLAAVESGNVFADLTSSKDRSSPSLNVFTSNFRTQFAALTGSALPEVTGPSPLCGDHVTELVFSYRFSSQSPVAQLSQWLQRESSIPSPADFPQLILNLSQFVNPNLNAFFQPYRQALEGNASPQALLQLIQNRRLLCPQRSGPFGIEALNARLGQSLLDQDLLDFPLHGLPFLIRSNNRQLGLWNGDLGVFFAHPGEPLRAFLPPTEKDRDLRAFDPMALPNWEPAFAMTVHKSQGSEFDAVLLVLPEVREGFLSWELLYTAITRARNHLQLLVDPRHFGVPLSHSRRFSGLLDRLEN